jgi:hypothetical protein
MPERTNGAVLKTASPDEGLVGSNPTPPAVYQWFACRGCRARTTSFPFSSRFCSESLILALSEWASSTSCRRRKTSSCSAPGTGKTHVAITLGIRACLAGQRVLFATATEWVAGLADPSGGGGWPRSCAGSRDLLRLTCVYSAGEIAVAAGAEEEARCPVQRRRPGVCVIVRPSTVNTIVHR